MNFRRTELVDFGQAPLGDRNQPVLKSAHVPRHGVAAAGLNGKLVWKR
jgi:hypothetical protein